MRKEGRKEIEPNTRAFISVWGEWVSVVCMLGHNIKCISYCRFHQIIETPHPEGPHTLCCGSGCHLRPDLSWNEHKWMGMCLLRMACQEINILTIPNLWLNLQGKREHYDQRIPTNCTTLRWGHEPFSSCYIPPLPWAWNSNPGHCQQSIIIESWYKIWQHLQGDGLGFNQQILLGHWFLFSFIRKGITTQCLSIFWD